MRSLHVMRADFTLKREIADFGSLRIKRSFRGVGEFELHLPVKYAELIERDDIIFPPEAPHKAMMVEGIRITIDDMTVTGCTVKGIVKRRICVPGASSEGTYGYDRIIASAETVLKHYASANCVETESAARKISCLAIEPDEGRGRKDVPWSARFENLADVLENICIFADCGYAVTPDFVQKKMMFRYDPGRDLVNGKNRVTFSASFGNVSGATYTEDAKNHANAAYIGGAGQDENRAILGVGDAQDLARREMWCEAGSISDPQELEYEAEHKIAQKAMTLTISAEVIAAGAARYGEDWDLGDLVTVSTAGKQMHARITQVQETHEAGRAIGLSVTFGEPQQGIIDAVKAAARKEGIR